MKFVILIIFCFFFSSFAQPGERITISHATFIDKIKGGWAGQYIGSSFVSQQPLFASNDSLLVEYRNTAVIETPQTNQESVVANIYPDLLYLSLVEAHNDRIEAPLSEHLRTSGFLVGHAMQTAGYNLRNGLAISSSGRWTNNPHAEDSDFAKGADVLGLMSPAMPRTLSKITEPIGHSTHAGEGYYGGVYIATLNALAFVFKSPDAIVNHALKALPEQSDYRKCLEDVAFQTKQHPNDWKKNWDYLATEWKKHTGCPFNPSSVERDARIYTALVTLVLLAGEGNVEKTVLVASAFSEGHHVLPTVLGLLGVMNGFESLPSEWRSHFDTIADVKLHDSLPTLNEACSLTAKNALRNIGNSGGKKRTDGDIMIRVQHPSSHGLERGFPGHYIAGAQSFNSVIEDEFEFEFEGVGFVLHAEQISASTSEEVVFAELYLNNKYIDRVAIPANKNQFAADLCWKLQLPHKKYRARLKLLKPKQAPSIMVTNLVVYDVMPLVNER